MDWLTLTHQSSEFHHPFNHYGRMVLDTEEDSEHKRFPWKLRGYEGWHVGRASHGIRDGGSILQLSGQAAADRLDTATYLADNVSRVDIAVTVRLDPPDPDLEREHWGQYLAWLQSEGSAMKGKLECSSDGSATMYVGRRTSPRYFRIYNKELEDRDAQGGDYDGRYDGCHRYELEVKGDQARPLAEEVSMAPLPGYHITCLVAGYCRQHGIDHSPFPTLP